MTGLDGKRVYLDWNATAPLRPEARAAMLDAMDVVGNPSSVHAEGRAAKKIVERARGQVAALVGCEASEVVFTSGATEALQQVLWSFKKYQIWCPSDLQWEEQYPPGSSIGIDDLCVPSSFMTSIEHDALMPGRNARDCAVFKSGVVRWDLGRVCGDPEEPEVLAILQTANSETGVKQHIQKFAAALASNPKRATVLSDLTQSAGREHVSMRDSGIHIGAISAHKFGGPKGIGALLARNVRDFPKTLLKGGGQENSHRAGTENVIGIAGFGAAAEVAQRDLEAGVWDRVEKLRNILEARLAEAAGKTIFFGQESPRLPNTSCFAVPGWAGETQVMQMDLAGFAVSAGSACSSGKVQKASRVLLAMGFDEVTASSAIRVSMGPTTTEAEVMAFADTWIEAYRRRESRAA